MPALRRFSKQRKAYKASKGHRGTAHVLSKLMYLSRTLPSSIMTSQGFVYYLCHQRMRQLQLLLVLFVIYTVLDRGIWLH